MKKVLFLFILLLIVPTFLLSQVNKTGTPIINYFDAMDTPGDMQNLCITMDRRGVMFFGNRKNGVMTYDGLQWNIIPLKSQQKVNALTTDRRGIVYVGGTSDFGFLQPDIKGNLRFVSLADRLNDTTVRHEVSMISSIACDSNKTYFTDKRKLYIYDCPVNKLSFINLDSNYGLRNVEHISVIENHLIIADNREGLFELKDGIISGLPGGNKIQNVNIVSVLFYGPNQLLLATRADGIFILNYVSGEIRGNFLSRDNLQRLQENNLVDGIILPGNRFAFGVESGEGIYIFDHDGNLQQQICGETTGLPESTITSMYCDYKTNSQMWFCSMGYISRAYVSLPVSEFGSGTGLKASLDEIGKFNGSVFVSFDFGIYRSFNDFNDRIRFAKVNGISDQAFSVKEISVDGTGFLFIAAANGLYLLDRSEKISCLIPGVETRSIFQDVSDPTIVYTGTDEATIITLKYTGRNWNVLYRTTSGNIHGSVSAITQSKAGKVWFSTSEPSGLYCMNQTATDTTFTNYLNSKGVTNDTINQVTYIDNILYLCTGNGLYHFNDSKDVFEKDTQLLDNNFPEAEVHNLFKTPKGDIWVSGTDSRNFDALVVNTKQGKMFFRRQFDILPDVATSDVDFIDGNIWLVKGRSIYVVDKSKLGYNYGSFSTILTKVVAGPDSVLMSEAFYTAENNSLKVPSLVQPENNIPSLKHSLNNISFRWTTTCYVGESKTDYRFKLDGYDHNWSKWEKRTFKDFTNLPHGNYTFRLKGRTITGLESREITYKFSIRKPWYISLPALILYLILFTALIFAIFKSYNRRLLEENIRLEDLVQERTSEVVRQKDELESSIHYASRIQRAILPSEDLLNEYATNYFILFKPKEIVSGDFYWFAKKEDKLFIVVADCTGHGVPGAFMSLLGISFLDEIVNKHNSVRSNLILNELRHQVVSSLKQIGETDEQKDGMDLGLIIFDYKLRKVQFSGAYNSCFSVRKLNNDEKTDLKHGSLTIQDGAISNGKYILETVRADKMPIGISFKMDHDFTRTEWDMKEDVAYYLYTDGYIDQFNGNTGKKFLKKNLKKLILEIQDYPMKRQKEILEDRLKSWMGSSSQLDDILVLGLKL